MYFISLGFDPSNPQHGYIGGVRKFFDISVKRAIAIFIPRTDGKYTTRKDVLAALRVLLLEKMAQQIDISAKPGWSPPRIEELADVVI